MRIPRLLALIPLTLVQIAIFPAGCGKGAPDRVRIGFLVKRPEELWFQNEWKFAQKCADQHGFDLIKMGVLDGEKVLSAIDNLAAQGAKGFVISTPDVQLGPAILARAAQNGMKVYSVDDQFVGPDGKFLEVPYMGISARSIGEIVGKTLVEEWRKRGWKVEETGACALTFDELDTAKHRTDGTAAILAAAGFPESRIHRSALKTTDVPGAFDAATSVLTQHSEVRRWLAFSVNDEGVLGTVRAMENRGLGADDVIGVGIGGETGCLEFEKEKPTGFFATCVISPRRHGFETAERLFRWIKEGVQPPLDIRTEGVTATRETYRTVLKDLGLAQ
jgi:L-arabinose transport system substrate-binding protein